MTRGMLGAEMRRLSATMQLIRATTYTCTRACTSCSSCCCTHLVVHGQAVHQEVGRAGGVARGAVLPVDAGQLVQVVVLQRATEIQEDRGRALRRDPSTRCWMLQLNAGTDLKAAEAATTNRARNAAAHLHARGESAVGIRQVLRHQRGIHVDHLARGVDGGVEVVLVLQRGTR